jgi:hypothetical protein
MKSAPFARAKAMMAAIAGIMTVAQGAAAQAKIAALGPYVSRGKGEGKSNRSAAGAGMANHRKAMKLRNVRRHRAAVKG